MDNGASTEATEIDWAFNLVDNEQTLDNSVYINQAITGFDFTDNYSVLLIVDNHSGYIRYYDVPTAGDLGSINASTDRDDTKAFYMFDVTGEVGGSNDLSDIKIMNNGNDLIVLSKGLQYLYWLSLSTPSNPATASQVVAKSVDLSAIPTPIAMPTHVTFNGDGTKMYITDRDAITVSEYNLSTAYDPSTLTLDTTHNFSSDFTATSATLRFCVFRDEGTKMYLGGKTTNATEAPVFCYTLSTAYDPSTASRLSSEDFASPSDAATTELGDIHFYEASRKVYLADVYAASKMYTLTGNILPSAINYAAQTITTATQVNGDFAIVGNKYTGDTFNARCTLSQLNGGSIAFINQTDDELQRLDFDGTNWTRASYTDYSIGVVTNNSDITYLDTNKVLASRDGTTYQAYDHNGTTFVTNGSSVVLGANARVAGSSATRIFVQDATTNTLRCMDQSGGTWTQTGSSTAITLYFQAHAIAVLDTTTDAEKIIVHVYDNTTPANSYLTVYSFDGSTFTEETVTPYMSSDIDNFVSSIAVLGTDEIALTDKSLNVMHFAIDGSYAITQQSAKAKAWLGDLGIDTSDPYINTFGRAGNFCMCGPKSGASVDTIAMMTY